MTETAVRTAAHQAAVEDLERGLGPFDDAAWRADLALLTESVQAAALAFLADSQTLVALAARVPRSPGDERGGTPWTSFVREVAVAKKISDQAAHADVALAHALLERHRATVRLLQAGAVPAHRARLLVELCARYDDRVAEVADRLLADRLNSLPPWRLRQEVEQLALRLDPEGAARREAAATADRTASKISLSDAQAEAVLTGPAPLVQRWWDALTDRARALKAAGDPRNLGALRFDLAVNTDPRGLTGHDALSAAVGIPDPRPDRHPDDTDEAADDAADEMVEQAPPWGLGVPVRQDARCSRPVQVTIAVPAATSLGLSDEPGWLEGYGWISAPLSRQLLTVAELRKACVHPDSGQLLDLTDQIVRPPLTPTALREAVRGMVLRPHELRGTVTDTQDQHDPNPSLEGFVHARDRYCDGPTGTQVPARRTDTDHDRPWPAGPTAAWNLISRAARTHQLKHFGWTAVRDRRGTTWTSPAGQIAFSPRFDHPPPPLPPDIALPDPDTLAASDAALVQIREWPDPRRPADRISGREPPRPVPPGADDERHGWPDDPPF